MADSSLDDFFAKKDKSKKSKTKSKFTTTETIAKKLEEGGKKGDYIKKDSKEKNSLSSNSANTTLTSEQEDDEWKNIEDESERDYSGLRIQALSISEREKEEEQLKEQLAEQSDEIFRMAEGQSGPWKIVTVPTLAPEEEEEEGQGGEAQTPENEVSSPAKPVYKPPQLRNISTSNTPSNTGSKRHQKSAPQISSEVHFPSLSSAAKAKYSDADRSFQSVKHGVRSKTDAQPSLQLDLENKFSALHQGE